MGKTLYFLVYSSGGLELRVIELHSRPVVSIKGVRGAKVYKSILSVLDAYALHYDSYKDGGKTIVELPADVGYASLAYILFTYSVSDPEKYLSFFEKLLAGEIPLTNYLGTLINLAFDLSELEEGKRDTTISESAAKTVSKMMIALYGRFLEVGKPEAISAKENSVKA